MTNFYKIDQITQFITGIYGVAWTIGRLVQHFGHILGVHFVEFGWLGNGLLFFEDWCQRLGGHLSGAISDAAEKKNIAAPQT